MSHTSRFLIKFFWKSFTRNFSIVFQIIFKHFESQGTIYLHFFDLKPVVVSCYANAIVPPPIALENCLNPQKIQQVSQTALEKNFCWGLQIFCEWRHKWSSFGAILAHVTWPRAQLLGQSISLKFSLETKLESESFIDFLAFLVEKLWSKINKLIYYLIKTSIKCFYYFRSVFFNLFCITDHFMQ